MMARTILVTGASRGIGKCIVQSLATHNPLDHIILAARSAQAIEPAVSDLRRLGITSNVTGVELDVTNDDSIAATVAFVKENFGNLDGERRVDLWTNDLHADPKTVLVNNAGIAVKEIENPVSNRKSYASIFDTNVTSVANVTRAFLPLMTVKGESPPTGYTPRVINISSGRASLTRSVKPEFPPTAVVAYSVSKVALNALTIEMQKVHSDILFYAANPGHCATEFNNFTGKRDPLEGARVVVELVNGNYGWGFWEAPGAAGRATRVEW